MRGLLGVLTKRFEEKLGAKTLATIFMEHPNMNPKMALHGDPSAVTSFMPLYHAKVGLHQP